MIEKKLFIGGMNKDDAHSVVPAEDWLDATNIRFADDKDGGSGKVKNIEGNILVSGPLTGTYSVIGAIQNQETNDIYYFVTGDEDYILKYDGTTITIALDGSIVTGGLNFSNYIHSKAIVNDSIYFTDNDNEPRAFHINRDYGSTIEQEDLKLIKRGPSFPLSVSKIDSSTSVLLSELTNNFTKGQSFQFAYRYIYEEYQYSVLSPFSELITHNRDDEEYDAIYASIPFLESIPNGVTKVEFLVRYGNSNSFYIIDSLDGNFIEHNAGNFNLDTIYQNDTRGIAIADEKAYKVFDNVPLKSETVAAARNRLFLGNNLVGYDPVEVDLAATFSQNEIGSEVIQGEYIWVRTVGPSIDSGGVSDGYQDYLVVKVEDGESYDGYYIYQDYLVVSKFTSGSLTDVAELDAGDKIADIGDSLSFVFENEVTSTELIEVDSVAVDTGYTGTQPTITGLGGEVTASGVDAHFKTNSWYRVGLVFYDNEGRSGGVSPKTIVVRTDDRDYSQSIFDTALNWEILSNSSVIPSWATHYQIVRTQNQFTSFFVQMYTQSVRYVKRDLTNTYELTDDYVDGETVGIAFDLSKMYENGVGYTYQEGDLVRYYSSDNMIKETFQVIDTWGSYVITEYFDLGSLPEIGGSTKQKCLLEIYTPYSLSEEELFYEVSQCYKITDGDFSVKEGSFRGDVFLTERSFDAATLLVEAMNRNDKYWKLWHTDIGRASAIIRDDGQKRLPTNIAYSNTFVEGSKINGLNSFDLLDNTDLDASNGAIQKLVLTTKVQEYGTVMLAICKYETNSIYLGETQILDDSSNAILATSGNVIGTVNALRGSYGTLDPESVAASEGRVYWVDRFNGKVIRYDVNGLFPISDYKLTSYWRDKTQTKTSDYVGGYDEYHEEYLIKVSDTQVFAFAEKFGRWSSFYDYGPEALCSRGIVLISFKNGQLYTHNSTSYSQFYGTDYTSSLTFLANESFSYQRQFKVLHIEGDTSPSAVVFNSEEPWDQQTDAVAAEIDEKEGVYYVPIFRDINSPNTAGSEAQKRLSGDILQGKFLKVAATWDTRNQFSVYAMGILCKEAYGHRVTVKQEM